MAENKNRKITRWLADFAIGEVFSQAISWFATNWHSLVGGAVLSGLSLTLPGVTGLGPVLFVGFASFLLGGATIAAWRNQLIQRRILNDAEHKLIVGNCVLARVDGSETDYQLQIAMKNTSHFPIETKLKRTHAKLNGSLGRQGHVFNTGNTTAAGQITWIIMNTYTFDKDESPFDGEVHLDIEYGHIGKAKYPLKLFSRVSFAIDDREIVQVHGNTVEPFELL